MSENIHYDYEQPPALEIEQIMKELPLTRPYIPGTDYAREAQEIWRQRQAVREKQRNAETERSANDWERLTAEQGYVIHFPPAEGNSDAAFERKLANDRLRLHTEHVHTVAQGARIDGPDGRAWLAGAGFDVTLLPHVQLVPILISRGVLLWTHPEEAKQRASNPNARYIAACSFMTTKGQRLAGAGIEPSDFAEPDIPPTPAQPARYGFDGRVVLATEAIPGRAGHDGRAVFDAFIAQGKIIKNPHYVPDEQHDASETKDKSIKKKAFFSRDRA